MAYGLTIGEMSNTRNWVFLKDAGNVVRPEFHIIASYAQMETTEDSFTEGEIGRNHIVWDQSNLGIFKDVQSLIKKVTQYVSAPTNPRLWGIWDEGRIGCGFMVDDQNSEATDREIAEWKKGQTRLWSAELTVNISFSRIWTPDEAAMKKTLGLQVL